MEIPLVNTQNKLCSPQITIVSILYSNSQQTNMNVYYKITLELDNIYIHTYSIANEQCLLATCLTNSLLSSYVLSPLVPLIGK